MQKFVFQRSSAQTGLTVDDMEPYAAVVVSGADPVLASALESRGYDLFHVRDSFGASFAAVSRELARLFADGRERGLAATLSHVQRAHGRALFIHVLDGVTILADAEVVALLATVRRSWPNLDANVLVCHVTVNRRTAEPRVDLYERSHGSAAHCYTLADFRLANATDLWSASNIGLWKWLLDTSNVPASDVRTDDDTFDDGRPFASDAPGCGSTHFAPWVPPARSARAPPLHNRFV